MDNKWNFEIMTDSAANLSEDVIRRYGLTILSQTYTMDGVEYRGYEKGKDISAGPVYKMMREKKEIRTSLVNAQEAEQEAEQLLRAGKDILYIGLSSALSGTFQVVRFTFEELQEKYPDRQLAAVDSLSLSLGEGELVLRAAKMREEGFSLRQTEQWLESNRLCLRQEFTVEDLFYLKRGGRIGTAAAVLGAALQVKPMLRVDDKGSFAAVGKTRGRKKSLDIMAEQLQENIMDPREQVIYIMHGDCLSDAQYLAEGIRQRVKVKEIQIRMLEPVLGSHSGPGTVGQIYWGKHR